MLKEIKRCINSFLLICYNPDMPSFLYPLVFAINNYLFYPFFSWAELLGDGSITYIVVLSLFYTGVTAVLVWPVLWWVLVKQHRLKLNPLWLGLLSAGIAGTAVLMVIFATFGMFYLLYELLGINGTFDMYLSLAVFLIGSPVIANLCIQLIIKQQKKSKLKLNHFFEPFSFMTSILYPSVLFGIIFISFWLDSGSNICNESEKLFVSSSYKAHSYELCFQRQNTAECPRTESELKAFKPEVYEQLLECYQPTATENGFFLNPKMKDFTLF